MQRLIIILILLCNVLLSPAQSLNIERYQSMSFFNAAKSTIVMPDFKKMYKIQMNDDGYQKENVLRAPYSDAPSLVYKETTSDSKVSKDTASSKGTKWQFGGNDFKSDGAADSCWLDTSSYNSKVGISILGWGAPSQFHGHWCGLNIGFVDFMKGNLSSREYGLNISAVNILLSKEKHIGFYSGLGVTYYDLSLQNNITINSTPVPQVSFQYINIPFMLEKQCRNRWYYSAGGMVNILTSNQSQVPLANYNAGVLLRGGYRFVALSVNYNFTPLMSPSQVPKTNLISATIGITF